MGFVENLKYSIRIEAYTTMSQTQKHSTSSASHPSTRQRQRGAATGDTAQWTLYDMRSPSGGRMLTPDYAEARAAYAAGWRYAGTVAASTLP